MTPFFGCSGPRSDSGLNLVGIPFEAPGSCRQGAAAGVEAIRQASHLLETYVPRLKSDFSEFQGADQGDVTASKFADLTIPVAPRSVYLGGDHTVAEATVKAVAQHHPELAVISLDAHLDAFEEYSGERHAHATWARRVGEELGCGSIWFAGVRAYTREEEDYARHYQRLLPLHEVDLKLACRSAVDEIGPKRPVYVTFDIDVLDPAYAPGVGNPESLGVTVRELWQALVVLSRLSVVAFDVVEVIPRLDPSTRTAVVAAELVRDFSLLCWGE